MSTLAGRMLDVSLPIVNGGIAFPGDPPIRISPHQSIAAGDPANVSALQLGSHSGTHIDAPRHFIEGAVPVDAIPFERLVGPAVVLALPDDLRAIDASALRRHELGGARRLLFRTRNSALLRSRQFTPDYAYVTPDGAEHLLGQGVELVGIDYLSIERFDSGNYPVHRMLLQRGVVIVEGLDLSEVPPGRYELVCLPLRLAGLDGAPARVLLIST